MFLSKHKNGYYYIYYFDQFSGTRKSISTKCRHKNDALKYLTKFRANQDEKYRLGIQEITLKSFSLKFLRYSSFVHTAKTSKNFKSTFNCLIKYFGNLTLNNLNTSKIKEYLEYKIKTSSHYSARRDLINISSIMKKALDDRYVRQNPCLGIANIRIPEKQPKFFSQSEYGILIESVEEEWFRNIIEFAFNTGMRQMEIITLRWKDIDFESGHITISNHTTISKSKKIRVIPMNDRVRRILKLLKTNSCTEFVFTFEGTTIKQDHISKKFKKQVRKLNINQALNFHSLRHTFASRLVQKGVSIYHVSKLLGHASVTTTQIYAHLRTDDLRKSVELLE